MTESEQTVTPVTSLNEAHRQVDFSEIPLVKPDTLDTTPSSDTLLKLSDAAIVKSVCSFPAVAPPLIEAMQRLIQIIAQLHEPNSGWYPDFPQTLENLIPYVTEEAYDTIDVIQAATSISPISHSPFPLSSSEYLFIRDLNLKLLWYIARSSYELMQLTGGVPAKLWQSNKVWQAGILRLVGILEIQTANSQESIDFVTGQSPPASLAPEAIIYFRDRDYQVQDLIASLIQQIQAVSPEIQTFLEPLQFDIFAPGKIWQSAEVKLRLELEFIPESESKSERDTSEDFLVRFADQTFGNTYAQNHFQNQLRTLTAYLQTQEAENSLSLPWVVKIANELFYESLASSRLPLSQTSPLNQWISYLLWELTRSSYEIMRSLGGIEAYILEPQWGWQLETLRLLAILTLKTIDRDLRIDLATGRELQPHIHPLSQDTLIQIAESSLNQTIDSVKNWLNQLILPIQDNQPILKLFRDGTQIEWLDSQQIWQPGLIKLSLYVVPDQG